MAKLQLTLSEDQLHDVRTFREAEGCSSDQEAIRTLLSIALSVTPAAGLASARALRAYHETRIWLLQQVSGALVEIKKELTQHLSQENALGPKL